MKKKIWPIVVMAVFVIIAGFLFRYRNAVVAVWNNLTAYKLQMDETDEWAGGRSFTKVAYATDSESQYLDLYIPNTALNEEKPQLFVLVHGGGFIYNDSQSRQAQLMYRYFRDQGYACATVNYRLAQEEPFPGALCDVKAAIRFLKAHAEEYGYSAEKVAIWGESAGGYLAVAATVTNDDEFGDVTYIGQKEIEDRLGYKVSAKVDVCVDYYGAVELSKKTSDWNKLGYPLFIIDIANSWLHTDIIKGYSDVESYWFRKETEGMTAEEAAYYDIYNYLNENAADLKNTKFWISHGDSDITVPILQSQRLYDTISTFVGNDNGVFKVVPKSGHAGDIMYTDEELSFVKAYLDNNL
ncbi:MAG: alpha/beta hydrolase [Butyrivibrio sp.]|nr:alpha/beta hydrolase [Butyrivibrio sp.]